MPARILRLLTPLLVLSGSGWALSPELTPGESPPGSAASPTDPQGLGLGSPAPAVPSTAPRIPPEPGVDGLPTIYRSEADLPEPVRQTRQRLLDAAKSGDIEQLRRLMEEQPEAPAVSLGDPGDPIEYLKELSSDPEGREMLAILLEVLETGFVHVEPGTADELYVWPYFAQYPPDALTPQQMVALFTLLTAADYEEMRSYGSYTFFRVGIAPDGRWMFFLAGS